MEFNYKRGINFGLWFSQFGELGHGLIESYNTEKDFELISKLGFDHVRLPIDYILFEDDENPYHYKESGFKMIDKVLMWAKKHKLNIILDMHRAPGFSFNTVESNDFLDCQTKQHRLIGLWQEFARRYKGYGGELCFELLNEIIDDRQSARWNRFVKGAVTEIRKIDENRIILVGSNYYNSISCLSELDVLNDENIVYTFHFYSPNLFTHQRASWQENRKNMDFQVYYPAKKEEYNAWEKMLKGNTTYLNDIDKNYIVQNIKKAADFAKQNNVKVYCGELGVICHAPRESAKNWLRDVIDVLNTFEIGHAVWNYKESQFLFTYSKENKELFEIAAR